MPGTTITFSSEDSAQEFSAYLSPSATGSGPGIIVLQEWWGLVDHIKDIADRFAAAGFTALAPDVYMGESTSNPDEAGKLMMALNIERTEKLLRGAVAALKGHSATAGGSVGTVGFCMGGQLALFAACNNEAVGACVDFYGIHPAVNLNLESLQAPVLGFFAERDGFVNAAAVTGLMSAMDEAGKRLEVHRYLDVDHAFFNDTRPDVYHEAHAQDAWQKTVAFFKAHLGD